MDYGFKCKTRRVCSIWTDLNVKCRACKPSEENIKDPGLWAGRKVIRQDSKVQGIKEQNKLDFIKGENFCAMKGPVKQMKRQPPPASEEILSSYNWQKTDKRVQPLTREHKVIITGFMFENQAIKLQKKVKNHTHAHACAHAHTDTIIMV